ncbi:MAG: response regulator [Lachnospiraceae bacterium]|nr:response regulator [Lachnospiraceae bacterium]
MNQDLRRIRQIRWLISALLIILGVFNSIICNNASANLGGFAVESTVLLVVGALCGNLPGILAVVLAFAYRALTDTTSTYVMALYLTAVLLMAQSARHRLYRSALKTAGLGLVIAAVIGAMNGFIFNIIMAGDISTGLLIRLLRSYAYALPESLATVFLVYAVFRFVPGKWKIYLPNGIYYIDKDDPIYASIENSIYERTRKETSGLSFRITRVVILEAILLTISAAAFAIHLVSIMETDAFSTGSVSSDLIPGDEMVYGGEALLPLEGSEKEPPDPRRIGILGEKIEDGLSANSVFDDERHFNPFERRNRIDSKTALAFAFRLSMILFNVGVTTAALFDTYLQYSVASPIRNMSEAMNGFAFSEKDGKIGGTEKLAEIRIRSKDEIKDLHNALIKTVSDAEEYLERLREEDKVRNELEVAKASNEAKSSFLSSMSHEIRTPINAVLGFDEMILMENKDPEIEKYAEDIQSAGRTLLSLINDILDFSKIEAGKMDIVPVQYELSSTINDVVNMTLALARDKGLTFDVNVDPKTPHLLYGDEIRIKQCMTNILSNAVKYTEKGGFTLDVGFEKAEGNEEEESILLNVSVKDTGIGIRKEDMQKLFSEFERLDQVRNRTIKGTGLGMSITKQLLENMGSKLEVDSEYGKGSVFSFSVKQKVIKWEEIGDLSEALKKYIPHGGAGHESDTFYAPKAEILVIDDTPNNLLVVTRLLKRTGISIDTAESGAKTLEMIVRKKYDAIYIDHMMPEMDGIETYHRMRELPDNKNTNTPVIVLTANAVSGSREMYMAEGFSDYMTKPVSYLALKSSLLKYIPKDKIEIRSEKETEQEDKINRTDEKDRFREEVSAALEKAEGIDLRAGIDHSGDEETLLEVIKGFSASIEDSSQTIEDELAQIDIKNYTVHVHALKSSARLIGAGELSDRALEMENAGNAYQKALADPDPEAAGMILKEIREKTPVLLDLYRSYIDKLSPAISRAESGKTDETLPVISDGELKEMLMGIREFAEAFDMDSVDSVMKMLEGYTIPGEKEQQIDSLKKAVRNVDRDAILSLLDDNMI